MISDSSVLWSTVPTMSTWSESGGRRWWEAGSWHAVIGTLIRTSRPRRPARFVRDGGLARPGLEGRRGPCFVVARRSYVSSGHTVEVDPRARP